MMNNDLALLDTDFSICVHIIVPGDLLLVDVENKDIAFSKETESKVTSLVWVQQENPQKKETIDSVLIKVNNISLLPNHIVHLCINIILSVDIN